MKDIFAVQDEIALAATKALQPKLLGAGAAASLQGTNPQAYQAYLKAKFLSGKGQSKEDLDKALGYANLAIQSDANYAPAWAYVQPFKTRWPKPACSTLARALARHAWMLNARLPSTPNSQPAIWPLRHTNKPRLGLGRCQDLNQQSLRLGAHDNIRGLPWKLRYLLLASARSEL